MSVHLLAILSAALITQSSTKSQGNAVAIRDIVSCNAPRATVKMTDGCLFCESTVAAKYDIEAEKSVKNCGADANEENFRVWAPMEKLEGDVAWWGRKGGVI